MNENFSLSKQLSSLNIDINPKNYNIATKGKYISNSDIKNLLKIKLEKPFSSKNLDEIMAKYKNILILTDDNTRNTRVIPVIEFLIDKYSKNDFSIMIANGTHRTMNKEEKKEKFGDYILSKCKIEQQNWLKDKFVKVGKTKNNTPIEINEKILKYKYIIGIGEILPHRCVGFSGGAKIIQPGVCSRVTTEYTHWMCAGEKYEDIMGNRENPIRKEIDEISKYTNLKFIINLLQDVKDNVMDIFCGDPIIAHQKGCEKAKDVYSVNACKADIVISDAHPSDFDLWQSSKAIYPSIPILKPNGIFILVSKCPDGISKTFGEQIKKFGYKNSFSRIKYLIQQRIISNKILASNLVHVGEIFSKAKAVYCIIPSIEKEDIEKIGFIKYNSISQALESAMMETNSKNIAILNNSPFIIPKIEEC